MKDNANYFKRNKATWNKKVAIHSKSKMYKMNAFKAGETSLMQYELKALYPIKAKTPESAAYQYYQPEIKDSVQPVQLIVR